MGKLKVVITKPSTISKDFVLDESEFPHYFGTGAPDHWMCRIDRISHNRLRFVGVKGLDIKVFTFTNLRQLEELYRNSLDLVIKPEYFEENMKSICGILNEEMLVIKKKKYIVFEKSKISDIELEYLREKVKNQDYVELWTAFTDYATQIPLEIPVRLIATLDFEPKTVIQITKVGQMEDLLDYYAGLIEKRFPDLERDYFPGES